MSAKKFRYKPEDFACDGVINKNSVSLITPYIAANRANALLEAEEKKCVKVYGIYSEMSERVDVWQPEKDVCSTHQTLLWNMEEIE